jgi:hypothetical protein
MPPDPPSRHVAGLSPETETLIMALLEKQPERRVQSARELAAYLTQIAQRGGWTVASEAERMSMPYLATPTDMTRMALTPTPTPPNFTPVFPPSEGHTPVPLRPYNASPSSPPQTGAPVQNPTTLSRATGQASIPAAGGKRSRMFGIAAGIVVVGAIAGVALVARGHRGNATTDVEPAAAASPTSTNDQPTAKIEPTVKPEPAKPEPAKPEPAKIDPATVATNPEPAKVDPATVATKPAPAKPVPATVATKPKPVHKVIKPAAAKPTDKPSKPGLDPGLIEGDL